ncbi:MAG: nucleoside kinase [Firmicutes bacterium]|nr:nucleoside kinase [Bacillota bacterium]
MENLTITLHDGRVFSYPSGTKLVDIAKDTITDPVRPIVGAIVNHTVCDLHETVTRDSKVQFIDCSHPDGCRMNVRGLSMLLVMAAYELFPDKELLFLHSMSSSLYCRWNDGTPMKKDEVRDLEKKMKKIIEQDIPFESKEITKDEAITLFENRKKKDKVALLHYRRKEKMKVYTCDGYTDYFFGRLPSSTGSLTLFHLKYYSPGLLLRYPCGRSADAIPPYREQRKLSKVYTEFKHWCDILDVSDVASLNRIISNGEINDLIRVSEALHEKKIAQIADLISEQVETLKLILIAGPSSSGKTTFAQRLAVQLRVNGLKPVTLSLDDYFVNKDRTPLDEDGKYDFDHIDAIDIPLFNDHLQRLLWGEKVSIPRYDFKTGCRVENHKTMQLDEKNILVIEGIHGLNEKLTESIPPSNKYKIYISALTQLNLDNHNRIPTTETRLIRRIVRDSQFRNYSALSTLRQWPSVRRGEERFIFPFQEEADVMFNSALVYELSVLKGFVEPLLREIHPDEPEHAEAKRLLSFTSNFLELGTDEIPPNSILREFVGATCFFKMEIL